MSVWRCRTPRLSLQPLRARGFWSSWTDAKKVCFVTCGASGSPTKGVPGLCTFNVTCEAIVGARGQEPSLSRFRMRGLLPVVFMQRRGNAVSRMNSISPSATEL